MLKHESIIRLVFAWAVSFQKSEYLWLCKLTCILYDGQIVRYGQDNIQQLKCSFKFVACRTEKVLVFDALVAMDSSHDIACYGTGRVAVAVVVDSRNDCIMYAVQMTDAAIKYYVPGLVSRPT